MTVDEVFHLSGLGTVVAGRVVSGVLMNGETVEVRDDYGSIGTARAGIMFVCGPNVRREPGHLDVRLDELGGAEIVPGLTLRRRIVTGPVPTVHGSPSP